MAKKRYSRARRYYRKARSRISRTTVPMGPIMGIIGCFAPAIEAGLAGRYVGSNSMVDWATIRVTGYNNQNKTWSFDELKAGWLPIVAGAAAHKLAAMLGVNAALGRAKVPFLRV